MSSYCNIFGLYGPAPGTRTPLYVQTFNTAIPSQPNPGIDYALNVPPSGEKLRSCWVSIGIELGGFPNTTSSTGVTVYASHTIKRDWGLGSNGGMVQIAPVVCPLANYAMPTGVSGEYGYDIMDPDHGHPYFLNLGQPCVDADSSSIEFQWIKGSQPVLLVFQLVLADDSLPGIKPDFAFAVSWSEYYEVYS